MRFQRSHIRYEPREMTTRRLASAKRKLERQAEALPLFAEQIRASQPTPEQVARKDDASWKRFVELNRRHDAERWLEGRRLLRSLPAEHRAELIAELLTCARREVLPARPTRTTATIGTA